ncbi:MAG: hypothetical protein ACK443_01185 [Methylococcaceae bacterium]|jgi:hypothetical protein
MTTSIPQKIVRFHFHVAVWLSILGGIAVFNDPDLMIPDEEGLFGPLRNNLLIALGYLVFSQIGLWYVRYLKGGYFEALLMGYTFAATAFGAKVYADVNGLPVSPLFVAVLIYFAIAHGLYYFVGQPQAETVKAPRD